MDSDFCVDKMENAIRRYGAPEVFTAAQGALVYQRGLYRFDTGIWGPDQQGRQGTLGDQCVCVERLYRRVSYQAVNLRAYARVNDTWKRLGQYFTFKNKQRRHHILGNCRLKPTCNIPVYTRAQNALNGCPNIRLQYSLHGRYRRRTFKMYSHSMFREPTPITYTGDAN